MTNCVKGLRCCWGYPANELVDIVLLNRMIILDRLIVKKLIAH